MTDGERVRVMTRARGVLHLCAVASGGERPAGQRP